MKLLGTITDGVAKAVGYVVDKNRKAALINRIRIVIKNERENEARAYIALGKYYFTHLRDKQNEETEHLCRAVEYSEQRMKKAFTRLDELTAPEGCDEDALDCTDDCDYCPYPGEAAEDAPAASAPDAPAAPAEGEAADDDADPQI